MIYKSRTFWTLIFQIAFNGFQAVEGSIPADLFVLVNMILGAVAMYFRINLKATK
jgi:hypothetical protein